MIQAAHEDRVGATLDDRAVEAPTSSTRQLRILLVVSAHNGLSQRTLVELTELGHDVEVAVVDSPDAIESAVQAHDPELIVCPFLKTLIPDAVWRFRRCLIVHPGPPGDRGPSSLDWAIELGAEEWGVTVLEATGDVDGGPVWASHPFPTRQVGKTSLYRHEVRRAAIEVLRAALARILDGGPPPEDSDPGGPAVNGRARPLMTQDRRAIDWDTDPTDTVLRKVRAGEGHPGVLDAIEGVEFHLFGAHPERMLDGRPGAIVAQRDGAICRATVDGAVWITHLKRRNTAERSHFKLPATRALELASVELDVPTVGIPFDASIPADRTYREIVYEEHGPVGYLHFDFYNGAMSTAQCRRLRAAYEHARAQTETRVIVLTGGGDYFSNGIHLNLIEASEDPATESWHNLLAIDDLVRAVIQTDSHIVVSALAGDVAAGGASFAAAADYVVTREDVVLNPYYRHMGGLYGSEYWTYLLPRRVGAATTARITGPPFRPLGVREAVRIGLVDATLGATLATFRARARVLSEALASKAGFADWLARKRDRRSHDEAIKPLQAYRREELARSHECFFGPDPSYHDARRRFVYKLAAPSTDRFHDAQKERADAA